LAEEILNLLTKIPRLVSMIRSEELKRAALTDSRMRRLVEAKGLKSGAQHVA